MVSFGPVTAEIGSVIWGTPPKVNQFRVLAVLLHGTLVVGVSQTLQRWIEGTTYIRQGGHHVGHWPTFLVLLSSFFSSPNLSSRRVDVYHTSTHGVALVWIYNAGPKCAARLSLKIQDTKIAKNSPCVHHHTTLSGYIFATAHVHNRKKLVKQQYLPHMSSQYGELRSTNGWDQFGCLRHPSKFQQVSHLGFLTAPTSLNGSQSNFARCLAISWAGTLHMHFRGLLPRNGILPGAKFTLHPSLVLSYICSVTARHSNSGCQPNFAAFSRGHHLYSAGWPLRWASAHISS